MSNKLLCAKKRGKEVPSYQINQLLDPNSQYITEKVPANWGGGRVNISKRSLRFFIHLIIHSFSFHYELGTVFGGYLPKQGRYCLCPYISQCVVGETAEKSMLV